MSRSSTRRPAERERYGAEWPASGVCDESVRCFLCRVRRSRAPLLAGSNADDRAVGCCFGPCHSRTGQLPEADSQRLCVNVCFKRSQCGWRWPLPGRGRETSPAEQSCEGAPREWQNQRERLARCALEACVGCVVTSPGDAVNWSCFLGSVCGMCGFLPSFIRRAQAEGQPGGEAAESEARKR